MQEEGDGLRTRLRYLERRYETLLNKINGVQSTMTAQDRQIENITELLLKNAESECLMFTVASPKYWSMTMRQFKISQSLNLWIPPGREWKYSQPRRLL